MTGALESETIYVVSDEAVGKVYRVGLDGQLTVLAGGGPTFINGAPALGNLVWYPKGIASDGVGRLVIAGRSGVLRIEPDGSLVRLAGGGGTGDNMPATEAVVRGQHFTVTGSGVLYFTMDGSLRKIENGTLSTVQVTGFLPYDHYPLANHPSGLLVGTTNAVYRIDLSTTPAHASIFAGTRHGSYDDGTPALEAGFDFIESVAVAPDGTVYVSERTRIRRIGPDGKVYRVIGGNEYGDAGDGGPAIEAKMSTTDSMAVGPDGSLYFADTQNHKVRKIDANGIVTTVAGTGEPPNENLWLLGYAPVDLSDDGRRATEVVLDQPWRVAVDSGGRLFITELGRTGKIRMIDGDGIISTIAGGDKTDIRGDGGPAIDSYLVGVTHLLGVGSDLYFFDFGGRIRVIR